MIEKICITYIYTVFLIEIPINIDTDILNWYVTNKEPLIPHKIQL